MKASAALDDTHRLAAEMSRNQRDVIADRAFEQPAPRRDRLPGVETKSAGKLRKQNLQRAMDGVPTKEQGRLSARDDLQSDLSRGVTGQIDDKGAVDNRVAGLLDLDEVESNSGATLSWKLP